MEFQSKLKLQFASRSEVGRLETRLCFEWQTTNVRNHSVKFVVALDPDMSEADAWTNTSGAQRLYLEDFGESVSNLSKRRQMVWR
jgi:hypothetical protein